MLNGCVRYSPCAMQSGMHDDVTTKSMFLRISLMCFFPQNIFFIAVYIVVDNVKEFIRHFVVVIL